jgi:Transposase DDE domain group 1
MSQATPLPFDLPAVRRKKLTVDFDGGNQSSDAGHLILRGAEQKIGVCARMAGAWPDRRDQTRIRHRLTKIWTLPDSVESHSLFLFRRPELCFERDRADVAEARVPSARVIEAFGVLANGCAGLVA